MQAITNHQFFTQQETDETGKIITRFEKVLLILFLLSIFALVINIAEAALYGSFGFFWLPILYWGLLFCGFYGGWKRIYLLIIIFFIGAIVVLVLTGIWWIVAFVDMGALAAICHGFAICAYNVPAIIALLVIDLIFYGVEFGFLVYAVVLCNKFRAVLRGPDATTTVVTTTTTQNVVMAQPVVVVQ